MYIAHVSDSGPDFTSQEIEAMFSVPVSRNLITDALDLLREARQIARSKARSSAPENYYVYRITREGILAAEAHNNNPHGHIRYFAAYGDEALDDIAGPDATWLTPDERNTEDVWSPLDIDRDNPLFFDAISKLEDAVEKIRGDNGFATTQPEIRNSILDTLEDGLIWLKEKAPSRAQIFQKILDPLRFIAGKFRDAVIGVSAKSAVDAIVSWLTGK
jgi:hypothetical protein